jgi:hypothetical protein
MENNEQINRIDWEVEERPIYANGLKITGYKGLFRGNSDKLLSIQKTSYSPTPNSRFIEVAEKLNEISMRCPQVSQLKTITMLMEERKHLHF